MERFKGIAMIIIGAVLWGATGPMMEWLLTESAMTRSFLIIVRMIVAGILLLSILRGRGVRILAPLQQKVWSRQLILFGIFGMLGVQYTFLGSIESSNAIIATLFQFLAPIFIIIFISWRQWALPPRAQVIGIAVTIIGLFLLMTDGSFAAFTLSKVAVAWGVAVGLTFAFYTLYPVRLMSEWGVLLAVGWGMLIGGAALFIVNPMAVLSGYEPLLDWRIAGMLALVVIVGTVAFSLFLGSMKYITPVETSILSSFEPLTAMVISVLWLGQVLGMWQLAGALVMLIGVVGLSIAGSKAREK
ncbi:DMT superfamily drug/metabolite transporter [Bacillus sp. OxB-1]|uniref:EamA family transporter n=1 Tax=Bacillus sp. (strain OxB-1) TaxID=98228 RepID=UPI0005820CDE|nr:DMT family transporter [Bacillus sp. OxB-1]BAQ09808.1 DMT superfamily drug/metabolite transporter [Bacillus sp. OxB-1]